jgi:hypothetical protein
MKPAVILFVTCIFDQVRLAWSLPNMASNMPRLDLPEPVYRNVTLGGRSLKLVEQRLVLSQVLDSFQ